MDFKQIYGILSKCSRLDFANCITPICNEELFGVLTELETSVSVIGFICYD